MPNPMQIIADQLLEPSQTDAREEVLRNWSNVDEFAKNSGIDLNADECERIRNVVTEFLEYFSRQSIIPGTDDYHTYVTSRLED